MSLVRRATGVFGELLPVVATHLPFNDNTVAGQTRSRVLPTPAPSSSTPQ